MHTSLLMKIADKYRSILHIENIDWCSILSSIKSLKNRFAKAIYKDMRKAMPEAFSPCPFKGVVKLIDIDPPDKFMSIVPTGSYLIQQKIVDIVQKVEVNFEINYFCDH